MVISRKVLSLILSHLYVLMDVDFLRKTLGRFSLDQGSPVNKSSYVFRRNVATGDFCSKCFREVQRNQAAAEQTAATVSLAARPSIAKTQSISAEVTISKADIIPAVLSGPTASSTSDSPPPTSGPCR
jgi:hypothetical protein